MPDDWSIPILIPVIAGLFALLGAFAGAWLARRTDYEKWLRQNRSDVYARFLELLAKAEKDATELMYDRSIDERLQSIQVTKTYSPVTDYVRVVRLYLPRKNRQELGDLAHGYFVLHSQKSLGDSRFLNMKKQLDKMQYIFESTL